MDEGLVAVAPLLDFFEILPRELAGPSLNGIATLLIPIERLEGSVAKLTLPLAFKRMADYAESENLVELGRGLLAPRRICRLAVVFSSINGNRLDFA
jgi:hypothetical protein